MAHSDLETRVASHKIFLVVLVPSLIALSEYSLSTTILNKIRPESSSVAVVSERDIQQDGVSILCPSIEEIFLSQVAKKV